MDPLLMGGAVRAPSRSGWMLSRPSVTVTRTDPVTSLSIVTPTYHTAPETLARTWASLKAQTFTDWEWVVYDDSNDDRVWRQLWGYCSDERFRVTPLRGIYTCGSIGKVKRRAFMAAEGDILVELDHDDELTPDAIEKIVEAFQDPEIGFVYSDWSEILPSGQSGRYPKGWAFGYGSDYWSDKHQVWVMRAPELNRTTLGHIVSTPNHVRAWRANVYRQLGGHDPNLPVADDYDLVVRTALATSCLHIPHMLYRQHISPHTAQRTKNAQIQENVRILSAKYASELDRKFSQPAVTGPISRLSHV